MPPDQHAFLRDQPDVAAALRGELADWRQWLGRLVVLGHAALAGLAVVAFNRLCDFASRGFATVQGLHPLTPLLWTPLVTAGIAWLTRRHYPGASGSGIPQVMAALLSGGPRRRRLVSLQLTVAKIVLTAGSLLAGLAVGREGPSVQIAAGVMQHARRWLPRHRGLSMHGLLVAGGAAGIGATFNAPLAGVMFAIEELASRLEQRSSGLLVAAIVLSGLVGVSFFGNLTYFGVIHAPALPMRSAGWALLVALAAGALGGVFARLLHGSITGSHAGIARWRARRPVTFAALCGLAAAAVGCASQGAGFGSGYEYTRALLNGHVDTPLLYVTLRVVATWLAVWSGVPGGIFAPCLAIGAGVGHDVALLAGADVDSAALIALGMAAFLAAVTQAPMTAFIIVMEMVDGHSMVLSLMAAALVASLVSRSISRPLYGMLMLTLLEPARAAPPAPAPLAHDDRPA